jgi:transcriptional regulator with XRE-family HTH domain
MVVLREIIGAELRRRRQDQGRTLREVSSDAKVSLGYLSEVERGQKEPSSELLFAICDALSAPLSEVLAAAANHAALRELQAARLVGRSRDEHILAA